MLMVLVFFRILLPAGGSLRAHAVPPLRGRRAAVRLPAQADVAR